MLICLAIGDTDPIRYRSPSPGHQFSGNIIDEAMRKPQPAATGACGPETGPHAIEGRIASLKMLPEN